MNSVKDICDFVGVNIPSYKNIITNPRISENFSMRRKWFNLFTGMFEKFMRYCLNV